MRKLTIQRVQLPLRALSLLLPVFLLGIHKEGLDVVGQLVLPVLNADFELVCERWEALSLSSCAYARHDIRLHTVGES